MLSWPAIDAALTLQLYRVLKSLRPPGAYVDDDEALHAHILKVLAQGLAYVQLLDEQLDQEIFPQSADETLVDWEALLDVAVPGGATLAQRRDAVLARWRGGYGNPLREIRRMLAPLLAPTHAFRDLFDSPSVSWRWTQAAGAGAIAQASGLLSLSIAAAAHGDWWVTGGAAELDGPSVRIPLVDREDDATLDVLVDALGAGASTAAGVALYESSADAWLLSLTRNGSGTAYVQLDRMEDGLLTRGVSAIAAPALPLWLRLKREGANVRAWYGPSLAALTELGTARALGTVRPREMMLWLRNTEGTLNAASVDFETAELAHGRVENNVEIIETPLSIVPAAEAENIFQTFVHRDPADGGSYNLKEAQRQINRAKLAHLLFLVGESDLFRCDDPYSLTDRDVLGA